MKIFKSQRLSELKEKIKPVLARHKRELIKNKNIVIQLVKRGIKVQYRNSAIGVLWTILNPLLNMLVMYIVFSTIIPSYAEDRTYVLYLLCGNIIFNTMRAATTQSMPSLVYNRGLLTKNKIAYGVFPLACNFSAIVNFMFSFIALLVVMLFLIFLGIDVFSPNIFLTLLMLPALFLFNYGISLMLSALYVFFRDVMHFYNVFLTLWMYFTPIFYKVSNLGTAWYQIVMKLVMTLNPMAHFVEYFRDIVYRINIGLESESAVSSGLGELYIIGIVFFALGTVIFSFAKKKFIFNL